MKKTLWCNATTLVLSTLMLISVSACKEEDIVHQKSLSELNLKAQQMMQSGDTAGAVARLEAAHDLAPTEPNTTFNLATAYQAQGQYDKAIALFEQLLKQSGQNQPDLHKNIAITYETKADLLESQAKDAEAGNAEKGQKTDATSAEALKQQSRDTYQLALQHYQQALSGKDAGEVQQHIDALQAKLNVPAAKP